MKLSNPQAKKPKASITKKYLELRYGMKKTCKP